MREINFDGLVGPTHNYAGLSYGNEASMGNQGSAASPRGAALEGLAKMKALADMGLTQGVIPPHERPHLPTLRRMGWRGADDEVVRDAAAHDPRLFASTCSASSMWVANAATVSPGPDTADGRVHFTPANLQAKLHRSIEPAQTAALLSRIFPDSEHFEHHPPLPTSDILGDEGAANHTRLARAHGEPGVEIFTYGQVALERDRPRPLIYPARQSREACALIARSHGLDPTRTLLVQQRPEVIDQGVFHNDVIAVGNENVLLIHQDAWVDQERLLTELDEQLGGELCAVVIGRDEVSVPDAVSTYLFNSQIVTLPGGEMALVCAAECEAHGGVRATIDRVLADASNPIAAVHYFDLTQSMRNGGGPACLRLRVALDDAQLAAVNPRCLLTDDLYDELVAWVTRHYRERLAPDDLADPALLGEVRAALAELTQILDLGEVYPFQRRG